MSTELPTPSQIAAWYHSQILRIPHGNQNPTKRYLDDEQVLALFDGTVVIQEMVGGKMAWDVTRGRTGIIVKLHEDMTGKHTPHDHVMKYTELPANKRIELESIYVSYTTITPHIMEYYNSLSYAKVKLLSPTIETIHTLLSAFASSPSHFGSPVIEGLVIKNYEDQLFGKWVNDVFEDQLHGVKE